MWGGVSRQKYGPAGLWLCRRGEGSPNRPLLSVSRPPLGVLCLLRIVESVRLAREPHILPHLGKTGDDLGVCGAWSVCLLQESKSDAVEPVALVFDCLGLSGLLHLVLLEAFVWCHWFFFHYDCRAGFPRPFLLFTRQSRGRVALVSLGPKPQED
jgi:hypothetical protein